MKKYIKPATEIIKTAIHDSLLDTSLPEKTGTPDEWGAKGLDFYTEEETAEKNEYKVYSLWED